MVESDECHRKEDGESCLGRGAGRSGRQVSHNSEHSDRRVREFPVSRQSPQQILEVAAPPAPRSVSLTMMEEAA